MKYEDYRTMYNEALRLDEGFSTVVLPVEVQPGETEDDAFIRFLVNSDFIEMRKNQWRIKDREKIESYDPNLLKILDSMIMATIRSEMDQLIELGFVYMTADEEGNIVYDLTEAGKEYLEN